MKTDLYQILEDVKDKKISVAEAELLIKKEPFAELDFAMLDLQRKNRQGAGEVVYGAGKTPEQIKAIVETLKEHSNDGILITKLDKDKENALKIMLNLDLTFYEDAQIAIVGKKRVADGLGKVVIVTGGTSDIPVAEEAAVTAEFFGNEVERIYDVGVAGLHRLLSKMDSLMSASVIIAIAGMEGALASVIGGLVSNPVIAVPTSVGYGASFGGMSALLTMINSCANGITVVNIDNGYGAGYVATQIYRLAKQ